MEQHDRVWARMWGFVRPYRIKLFLTFLLALLATPLSLLAPLPLRIAVDSIIGNHPAPWLPYTSMEGKLAFAAALLIGVTLLMYLQGLASWLAQTWIGEKLSLDLRTALFRHAQHLSLGYHDRTGITDSVYRIQYDAQSLQFVMVNGMIPVATSAITLCGMVVVTFLIDRQIAIVALAVCPLLYWITRTFNRRLRERWFQVKDLDSSAMRVVQEALSSVRVVKAFGQEEHEQERYAHRANERLSGEVDLACIQGRFDLSVGLTIATGTAIALVIGVLHAQSGLLTVGQLFVVMAYLAQIYEPLKTMSKKLADLQSGVVSAERALALLDELPDVPERPDAIPLKRARGDFRFDHVNFGYESGRPILDDVHLEIPAGTRVGIQGRTGAGKTTLISLLSRFYDPDSGAILLDSVDIRDYKVRDLRNQFAIVLQDPLVFSTTIRENIAYGRPEATQAEVITAAKDANAHEFIMSLPDGYETQVGGGGMRLSGGERQRISIARAFLKRAPILLLDEPTSSVDTATELGIMEAMERLMRGRTVFMIAHRLSTLRTCDVHLELRGTGMRVISSAA
jgi:ATP-binding cassette subfamily B protein